MNPGLAQYWKTLSPAIRVGLLQGSTGKEHCLNLARLALERHTSLSVAANPAEALNFPRSLLLSAWEQNPLNGDMANGVLRLAGNTLQPSLKGLLEQVAQNWRRPGQNDQLNVLLQRGDYERALAHIHSGMKNEPENLFWFEQLWELCWHENNLDGLKAVASKLFAAPALAPLGSYFEAQRLLAGFMSQCAKSNPPSSEILENALNHLNAASPLCGENGMESAPQTWLAHIELATHILKLLNRQEESINLKRRILKCRPWHASLALSLADQLERRAFAAPPPGKITLLLYSFNKAGDLNAAISALSPDACKLFKIVALDNGSSDNTLPMLKSWREKLGRELFDIISLPVNLGAPAARNWLITHEAVAASDFTIYLDDDALVNTKTGPGNQNWLEALGDSFSSYPDAAAHGLKILDYNAPYLTQSADLHVLPPEEFTQNAERLEALATALAANDFQACPPFSSYSLNRAHSQGFTIRNPAQAASNFGHFDYTRPCASVTGCCHMFKSKDLITGGGFNLSFSPSQYDDLERDLRHAAEGGFAAYSGESGVWHMQRTGRGRKMSPAAFGTGLANRYKLSAHFNEERVFRIMASQLRILEKDLLMKFARLE